MLLAVPITPYLVLSSPESALTAMSLITDESFKTTLPATPPTLPAPITIGFNTVILTN